MAVITTIVPNPLYNPVWQADITAKTKLGDGITMSNFFGWSDAVTINEVTKRSDRVTLAKQYYLHAEAIATVNSTTGSKQFEDFRLIVSEGFYKTGPSEELDISDGINHFKTTGQAVVYELRNTKGDIAFSKTFDLAVYWKNTINFNKLILDYDTYNPDGTLHACIILIMPEIISPWNVRYENIVETRFNNNVQTTNELMEVLI